MNLLTTNRVKPWHHVGHRTGLGDPFESMMAYRYCRTCQNETEHKKEFRYEGQVYGKKEWCACCGHIIHWGVFGGDEAEEPTRVRARQWAKSPERDRR